MNRFIEENRKLLVFYYWVTRSGGWVFLLLASLAIAGHSFALSTRIGDWEEFQRYYHHDVPWGMFSNALPTGLLALGIAQLIKSLLEISLRPGWVLRNAHKLLYVYMVILMGYYGWVCVNDVISSMSYEPHYFPVRALLLTAFLIVKLLVLVGAAEIARRVIPVIEESRTLI
jgi:hypothetical protein